ncbi:hypothetical protein [Chloroflexus sp.]|uniref:hypothetical protein n=1 Tax=Chloroflexus sp. TaxID=1904827 RepID=UPI002ADD7B90|nr:hypothetical protein [Chloroflexus sp.]
MVAKPIVCPHDGFANDRLSERIEAVSVHIDGIPVPSDQPAPVIQQPTKLDANAPATVVSACFTHLLRTAALSRGNNQVTRLAINEGEERWIGQKQLPLILMRFEQAL